MTQDKNTLGISRRKLLGGLGTVGFASAASGLGTTAFFNDEESFEDNEFEGGRLDLLTDYRITYEGGQNRADELNDLYSDSNYNLSEVEEIEDGVYLLDQVPAGESWENGANNDEFEPEDLTDAGFPLFNLTDVKPGDYGEATISLHLFDNPGYIWMHGSLEKNAQNGINQNEREELESLVEESDYEATGTDSKRLYEEPDEDGTRYYFDPEEDEEIGDDDQWGGQLADSIQARAWYDANCNNVYEPEEGQPVDVALVVDVSGSMDKDDGEDQTRIEAVKSAAERFAGDLRTDINGGGSEDRLGIATFGGIDNEVLELTDASDEGAIESAIDDLETESDDELESTNYAAGLFAGRKLLENDNGRQKVMVVLGDGAPTSTYDASEIGDSDTIGDNGFPSYEAWSSWDTDDKETALDAETVSFDQTAQDDAFAAADDVKDSTDIEISTIGFRLDELEESIRNDAETTLQRIASRDARDENTVLFYDSPTAVNLDSILSQIGESIILGEEVIVEGSLREVLDELSDGHRLEPDRLDDEESDSCFQAGLTYCIGFEWELPEDIGNEVQTDVVEFDIDFAAQQCRHNEEPTNPYA